MAFGSNLLLCVASRLLLSAPFLLGPAHAQGNVTIRVMAANLTSGHNQRYEPPGLHILKGLKPDIVAIQEFNYAGSNGAGINTPAAFREMLDTAFGTNFVYFREAGYSIPNGIISRYPIIASGSWVDSDSGVNDRGFAWAQIDVPGTNDLFVVSVHLKAGSSGGEVSRRAAEVTELKALISTNFPADAWLIVAGDFNVYSETEETVSTLSTILSDQPVPSDLDGGTNTNQGRSERYDRVWVGFSLTNSLMPVVMPSHMLPNGLVFVSTNYVPLTDVPPIQFGDSIVPGMQHLAVIKDFSIRLPATNFVVPPPTLVMTSLGVLHWRGVSNATYRVQAKTNLPAENWMTLGSAISSSTNFSFTDAAASGAQRFYRVTYP